MHAVDSALVALPLPRHGELAEADVATSSTDTDISVLPIEGTGPMLPPPARWLWQFFCVSRKPRRAAPDHIRGRARRQVLVCRACCTTALLMCIYT